jgi:hypothetical protein
MLPYYCVGGLGLILIIVAGVVGRRSTSPSSASIADGDWYRKSENIVGILGILLFVGTIIVYAYNAITSQPGP